MRVRMTDSEYLIMLADSEGWPVIKEDYEWNDVLVQASDGRYVYWKHDRGNLTYASDRLGPLPKPYKQRIMDFLLTPAGAQGKVEP